MDDSEDVLFEALRDGDIKKVSTLLNGRTAFSTAFIKLFLFYRYDDHTVITPYLLQNGGKGINYYEILQVICYKRFPKEYGLINKDDVFDFIFEKVRKEQYPDSWHNRKDGIKTENVQQCVLMCDGCNYFLRCFLEHAKKEKKELFPEGIDLTQMIKNKCVLNLMVLLQYRQIKDDRVIPFLIEMRIQDNLPLFKTIKEVTQLIGKDKKYEWPLSLYETIFRVNSIELFDLIVLHAINIPIEELKKMYPSYHPNFRERVDKLYIS
jgi:hypothetical protein